jgi:hypothetical protein
VDEQHRCRELSYRLFDVQDYDDFTVNLVP